MIIENSGMAETRIAVMAVPMMGAAKAMPASWQVTERNPSTASFPQPQEKSSCLPPSRAMKNSAPPATMDRKLTAPAQPKAATTFTTTMKERPHTSASVA